MIGQGCEMSCFSYGLFFDAGSKFEKLCLELIQQSSAEAKNMIHSRSISQCGKISKRSTVKMSSVVKRNFE